MTVKTNVMRENFEKKAKVKEKGVWLARVSTP